MMKRLLKWSARILIAAALLAAAAVFIAYWSSSNDCQRNAARPSNPMKAILSCEYGAENLKWQEIEKPAPADNEVLVRVHAVSVNPADGHLIRDTWLTRLMAGLRK